jgi:hypothetical protein
MRGKINILPYLISSPPPSQPPQFTTKLLTRVNKLTLHIYELTVHLSSPSLPGITIPPWPLPTNFACVNFFVTFSTD